MRLEAIPHVTPVGANLAEFLQPAERDAGRRLPARDPYFATVQQPKRAANQVGARELDSRPLPAGKL